MLIEIDRDDVRRFEELGFKVEDRDYPIPPKEDGQFLITALRLKTIEIQDLDELQHIALHFGHGVRIHSIRDNRSVAINEAVKDLSGLTLEIYDPSDY